MASQMRQILKIIGYFTGSATAIVIIGSLYLYFDSIRNKPLTKDEVKEVVKTEINPLRDDILFIWPCLDDVSANQLLLRDVLVKHLRQDSSTSKMNEIINLLNDYRNDIKKKDLPILLKPKE